MKNLTKRDPMEKRLYGILCVCFLGASGGNASVMEENDLKTRSATPDPIELTDFGEIPVPSGHGQSVC